MLSCAALAVIVVGRITNRIYRIDAEITSMRARVGVAAAMVPSTLA